MKFFEITALIVIIYIATGCTTNPNTQIVVEDPETDTFYNTGDAGVHSNIYYVFPSPDELMQMISESGAEFSAGLLNKTVNADKYTSQTAVNLNIGISLADLAYCGLFKQNKETKKYIELLSRMSYRIYLSGDLKHKLSNIKDVNFALMDSSEFVFSNLFFEIINDLETSGQGKTVAEISAGAYIESLYLSLHSFENTSKNNPVFKKLAEQQFAFKNMISYLRQFKGEKEIDKLIELLAPIENIYNKMQFTSKSINVSKNADSTIVISGGKVYKMDEETYNSLKIKTSEIRQDFLDRR